MDRQSNKTKQVKVKELEYQIDQMVYNLYSLTPEEIEIVEKGGESVARFFAPGECPCRR